MRHSFPIALAATLLASPALGQPVAIIATHDHDRTSTTERLAQQLQAQQQAEIERDKHEAWSSCRARWEAAIAKRDFALANALAKGCPATP